MKRSLNRRVYYFLLIIVSIPLIIYVIMPIDDRISSDTSLPNKVSNANSITEMKSHTNVTSSNIGKSGSSMNNVTVNKPLDEHILISNNRTQQEENNVIPDRIVLTIQRDYSERATSNPRWYNLFTQQGFGARCNNDEHYRYNLPISGVVMNLTAVTYTREASPVTFTVVKNCTDTELSCSISAGSCTNTIDTFIVNPGDTLSLKVNGSSKSFGFNVTFYSYPGNLPVNLMTFNTLVTGKEYSGWDGHVRIIVAKMLINKTKPDIIGFQEAHKWVLDNITSSFPYYSWFGERRSDKIHEYAAIMYDTRRFELLSQETFWLGDTPDVPSSAGFNNTNPRVLTWGLFRDKLNGNQLMISNTHFAVEKLELREYSVDLFLKRLWPNMSRTEYYVFMGDVNLLNGGSLSGKGSDYQQLSYRMWRVLTGEDRLNGRNANLVDIWDSATFKNDTYMDNRNDRGGLDWILHSPTFKGYYVIELEGHTEYFDADGDGDIDAVQATDHSPVFAKLFYRDFKERS